MGVTRRSMPTDVLGCRAEFVACALQSVQQSLGESMLGESMLGESDLDLRPSRNCRR